MILNERYVCMLCKLDDKRKKFDVRAKSLMVAHLVKVHFNELVEEVIFK